MISNVRENSYMIQFMQKQRYTILLLISVQLCYGSYTVKQNEITSKIEEYQSALIAITADKKYANEPNERDRVLLALAEEQCLQLIQFKIDTDKKRCEQDASQISLLMQNATEYQLGLWNIINTVYKDLENKSSIKSLQYSASKRKSYQKIDEKYKEWYQSVVDSNKKSELDDLYTNERDYAVIINNLKKYNVLSEDSSLFEPSKRVWRHKDIIVMSVGIVIMTGIAYGIWKYKNRKSETV